MLRVRPARPSHKHGGANGPTPRRHGRRAATTTTARALRSLLGCAFLVTLVVPAAKLSAAPRTLPLGLDAYMPVPESNPLTKEKIALGRKLFFDRILSRDRSISCSTCHDPQLAFTDNKPVAEGIGGQKGTRRTARLINRGYGRTFFWDGRAASIEEQVIQPIQNPIEMDSTLAELTARLNDDSGYAADFQEVFERPPDVEALQQALASYVRSIVSGNSPYDQYVAGDSGALTPTQRRGLALFRGKANCAVCHLGPNLTDEEFHNTGVGWDKGSGRDGGRAKVSGDAADTGAFKTPTLREIHSTGPYMHDGSLATLADVIDFYDKGGEHNPYLSVEMQRLHLSSEEKSDLAEFLKALSGEVHEGP
jgi:cytochrome c peroxidase